MKVIYITSTGDNTLELPTPLDVEGYLCGIVELAGKVVNCKVIRVDTRTTSYR